MPHECLGGGTTSPAAKKAWKALPGASEGMLHYLPRGKGRANQRGRRATWGSSFDRDLKSANVFLMDWVCDGWGKLPPKIQRIADKVGALTAAEKKTLVQWFRDTAPGNF